FSETRPAALARRTLYDSRRVVFEWASRFFSLDTTAIGFTHRHSRANRRTDQAVQRVYERERAVPTRRGVRPAGVGSESEGGGQSSRGHCHGVSQRRLWL